MRLRNTAIRPLTWIGLVLCASGALVAVPLASDAAPTPPPNPSAGQISAAQAQKDQLANQVGVLNGRIAAARSELAVLQGKAEMLEQKVAYAVSKERDAEDAVHVADAKVAAAARTVTAAHTKFVRYLQSSYESGQPDSGVGALLTAKDPSGLLQQTTLEQYAAQNKLDAVGQMQTATVHKANLDAEAKQARVRAKKAEAEAEQEKRAADDAVAAQQAQAATLQQTLTSSQTALNSAQSQLATLNHQHAQYVAYQAEQARLRAARLRQERAERARKLAEERAAAQRAAKERAAEQARERSQSSHSSSSSGGSSSGGSSSGGSHHSHHSSFSGGSSDYDPVSPSGGSWTPARGREAVSRAMDTLGTPYAWAGGGASGPSYGVCDSSNGAPNDCNVVGFDCSGLAMYAWGPYESMPHYAKSQYSVAGDKHPSLGDLKPGDLLFYSYNGSVSGIHHVAIYKGDGKIIQAPYSGAYVEVSSMYSPGPIFGATRPLT